MRCRLNWIVVFILALALSHQADAQDAKPNVLFIIIDDLNDYTTTLSGHPQVATPAISSIEAIGTTFTNAHCSSPKCSPSRTSFLTGKDVHYTQVYNNIGCLPFREYFTEEKNNEIVYTLPEHLKDKGGYFTYGINKINHCFDTYFDFDSTTADPCSKSLSWNKYSLFIDGEDAAIRDYGNAHSDGVEATAWCPIPNSYEAQMYDYRAVDSAAEFIRQVNASPEAICSAPFFMCVGFRKPHQPWFIPEKYFPAEYCSDIYAEPFDIPYNVPNNALPYNGFVMPEQPQVPYSDFDALGPLGQYLAQYDGLYNAFYQKAYSTSPMPEINKDWSHAETIDTLQKVIQANAVMAYVASIRFLDAQISRLIDSLEAYPSIYNNTIIVLASDNGFSLGEKRHWEKGTMWETDMRVPFIIADLRAPAQQEVATNVSLLDIFPTICSLTETPLPLQPDGSSYLDGSDLSRFLQHPDKKMERPALSAYEVSEGELSCRPQFSIRSDRFHYIQYRSNGVDNSDNCAPDFITEDELYEIGTERTVDPNEWRNLANDPDYLPVIRYLQQWLPDSSLYLQQNYIARIQPTAEVCLLSQEDIIDLVAEISSPQDSLITPPESFSYVWTNNLVDTLLTGLNVSFPVSLIPESVFQSEEKIIWYLHVYDSTGAVKAFDLRYFYLNPEKEPEVLFDVLRPAENTVQVANINVTGPFQSIVWSYGDGTTISTPAPGPYTYASSGNYTISADVQYGNSPACIKQHSISVQAVGAATTDALSVFPNPNSGLFTVAASAPFRGGSMRVYNWGGQEVYRLNVDAGPIYDISINMQGFPDGIYYVQYVAPDSTLAQRLIIVAGK